MNTHPPARVRWVSPFHRGLRSQSFNNIVRGPLTDKQIAKYQEKGYYSAAFKQARREAAERKRKTRRVGSFVEVEGRMIYSPV